jgi:hypothetical protein
MEIMTSNALVRESDCELVSLPTTIVGKRTV